MSTTPTSAEREAFEQWAHEVGLMSESFGILSTSSHCDTAWKAWQARAAMQTAEPVGSIDKVSVEPASAPPSAVPRKVAVEALNVLLWLYRRLPRVYGRPPHVEQPIKALAAVLESDVDGFLAERGVAPDRAPSTDSAADANHAARYRHIRDTNNNGYTLGGSTGIGKWHVSVKKEAGMGLYLFGVALDREIDAAIAALQPEGE